MHGEASLDLAGAAWRLGLTLFFVVLNGFFVAAEFALVKVRASRIDGLAAGGSRRAQNVKHMQANMDLYLSACQLGITLASLILGALGEPAVSRLILSGAAAVGLTVESGEWLRWVSIGLAFGVITILHMTIGEQAPKMWALRESESMSLRTSGILKYFTLVLKPLIHLINVISNQLLRWIGLPASDGGHDSPADVEELRAALAMSAGAGQLEDKQLHIALNALRLVQLEVRHILVPRVDVEVIALETPLEDILALIKSSSHSRFPLCERDLDSTIGQLHGKDILEALLDGQTVNLRSLAREPLFVPDTMSLLTLLDQMQSERTHMATVLDEHGTAVGLCFREDALEEIVGPLGDEFDDDGPRIRDLGDGRHELDGSVPLPDLYSLVDFTPDDDEGEDTVAGYLTALLGRLPVVGDTVPFGAHTLTAKKITNRRLVRVIVEPAPAQPNAPDTVHE